jgi:hypothetical protein
MSTTLSSALDGYAAERIRNIVTADTVTMLLSGRPIANLPERERVAS